MKHIHIFEKLIFNSMTFTSQNERIIEKCNCGLIKYITLRKESN